MEVQVNESNFAKEVQESKGLTLVDFWAPWCGPCRILGPMIAEIAEEEKDVKVAKVNVDEDPSLAAMFGIRGIPTVILFKDGKPVEQIVGLRAKQDFLAMIDKYRESEA